MLVPLSFETLVSGLIGRLSIDRYENPGAEWGGPGGAGVPQDNKLPILSISLDQGSVGWPSLFYAMFVERLLIVPLADAPHRIWNDIQQSIEQVREFKEARYLTTILFNLNTGPFESAAWWQQVKAGVDEYCELAGEDDPLLLALIEDIADERNEGDRVNDRSFREQILAELPRLLANKGSKVPRSRWFHFIDSATEHDTIWSSRMLVLLYLGLRAGYVNKECGLKFRVQLAKGASPSSGTEPAKMTTSGRAPEVMGFLRPNCRNTMHVATCLYLERTLKMNNRVIAMLAEPFRIWHGRKCQANRDPTACQLFCIEQSVAEFVSSSTLR